LDFLAGVEEAELTLCTAWPHKHPQFGDAFLCDYFNQKIPILNTDTSVFFRY
jgi:hypothetical protein